MNILYLNHYAGSPRHGMEFRPYYLAREWVRAGHQVNIVAADYSHLRQHNSDCPDTFCDEDIDGIRYTWCKTPPYEGNGVPRVINIFSFLRKLYRLSGRYRQEWRPDLVIASSTYPLDMIPARHIARQCGATLVYEVHDLWPLTPVEVGGMSPKHPFIRLLQWAEDYSYRHADRVISMLPCAREYMQQHGMDPAKYDVIPNGIATAEWQDTDEPLPALHMQKLAELKAQQRFLIGYAGGHGLANALDDLINAAAQVRDTPITLVLVGDGPDKAALQQQAESLQLDNVVFLPAIAKRAVPALLARMDALYIGWRKLPIYRFGLNPNKLFDYLMAGRPVLHAFALGNDIVAQAGAGITVEAENPSAIADGLRQMAAMPAAERERLGQAGRRYVLAQHDYRVLAQRFLDACTH